jgi:hypothetical protein
MVCHYSATDSPSKGKPERRGPSFERDLSRSHPNARRGKRHRHPIGWHRQLTLKLSLRSKVCSRAQTRRLDPRALEQRPVGNLKVAFAGWHPEHHLDFGGIGVPAANTRSPGVWIPKARKRNHLSSWNRSRAVIAVPTLERSIVGSYRSLGVRGSTKSRTWAAARHNAFISEGAEIGSPAKIAPSPDCGKRSWAPIIESRHLVDD